MPVPEQLSLRVEARRVPKPGVTDDQCPKCGQKARWTKTTNIREDGDPVENAGCDNCGLVQARFTTWTQRLYVVIRG